MKDNKIIHFPKLKETLTEKGMAALKNQDYAEALKHFDQLLTIDPKHPQANLGKAICYIQQDKLLDAADICEFMLDEKMTNAHEVIQVYISVLIQLEQYKKAVNLLKKTLNEEKLPSIVINYYEHMLQFCRQMIKDKAESISQKEIKHLSRLLYSDSFEKQMLAIQKLTSQPNESMLEELNQYLKNEQTDPVIKSIIVQHLMKEKVDTTLEIQKFKQRMLINPIHLQAIENNLLIEEVKYILSDVIESKNPTLYQLSMQILSNVVLTLYPFPFPAYKPKVIAAVIHIQSKKTNGIPFSVKAISSLYNANDEEVNKCFNELDAVMNFSNKP